VRTCTDQQEIRIACSEKKLQSSSTPHDTRAHQEISATPVTPQQAQALDTSQYIDELRTSDRQGEASTTNIDHRTHKTTVSTDKSSTKINKTFSATAHDRDSPVQNQDTHTGASPNCR
jgi:hypothetical protein